MKRKRPFGVKIIALVLALDGISSVLTVRLSAGDGGATHFTTGIDMSLAVLGLAGLIVAIGLWWLQRWAWVGTMLLVGIELVITLVSYLHGHPRYVEMVLYVICVFYLNQRGVQHAFRPHEREQAPAA